MSRPGAGEAEPGRAQPCLRQDVPGVKRVSPTQGQSVSVPVPVPPLLRPSPGAVHYPRDPLGLCSRPRRAPKLGQIGRSKKVDIEDSVLEQFLGRGPEKPTSHL